MRKLSASSTFLLSILLSAIICLYASLSIFVCTFPAYAKDSQNIQEEKKVIRIGYRGNRAIFKNPYIQGHEGYGYEYINKLLQYTKQEYHPVFIEVGHANGAQMLINGELDLLPFVTQPQKKHPNLILSHHALTEEQAILLPLKENKTLSSNYQELGGSKICVFENNKSREELKTFLVQNNIKATVQSIPYAPIEAIKAQGEFDYIVSNSLQLAQDTAYSLEMDTKPVYMMANEQNRILLQDFDQALEVLQRKDFLFEKKLAMKYFGNLTEKKAFISQEELALLQDTTYSVGVSVLNTPLSFYEVSDKLSGVFMEIVEELARNGGFQVRFHVLPDNASDEIINKYDFFLLPEKNENLSRFNTSIAFAQTPYLLIKNDAKSLNNKVGLLNYFNLDTEFLNFNMPSNSTEEKEIDFISFDSPRALIEAYNKKELNSIILTRAIYNAFYSSIEKNNIIQDLGFNNTPVISFSKHFPQEKITTINKLIANLDHHIADDSITRNVAKLGRYNILYYVKTYWYLLLFTILLIPLSFLAMHRRMKKQKEQELKWANEINPLTGLYTFQKFLTEARQFLDKTSQQDLRIVAIDIDNFRYINEVFGFDIGSQVLQQLGHHIKRVLTITSPVAHYAGDIFCILTPKENKTCDELIQALHIDILQKTLEPTLGKLASLSLSLGVYDIEDKNLDIAYMIDCAHIARSKSKAVFGTHVEVYTEDMKEEYTNQNVMLSLVKTALKENEFELFYQPKFDIETMQTIGAEALIRWFKDGKMIPPDSFIPIVEKNGLIHELDYHVVELACIFLNTYKNSNIPHISINISGFTIIKKELIQKVTELIKKYDIKPAQLDIEITESALVNNFDKAINQIEELRKLGFTISMDDFGTGVSSLNRLSQMPLDTIKLDRVFIIDALENKKTSLIIKTIIELAKRIEAKTVAEGIETIEQLEFLRNLSCEYGQGYFYSRPLPVDKFLEHLEKAN